MSRVEPSTRRVEPSTVRVAGFKLGHYRVAASTGQVAPSTHRVAAFSGDSGAPPGAAFSSPGRKPGGTTAHTGPEPQRGATRRHHITHHAASGRTRPGLPVRRPQWGLPRLLRPQPRAYARGWSTALSGALTTGVD